MAIDVLTVSFKSQQSLLAQDNITGFSSPLQVQLTPSKTVSYSATVANAAAGGADVVAMWIESVAASSTATIDLQSITNLLQQTAVSLARVKSIRFHLLSSTLDSGDDATNGSACSSVTIGNSGASGNQLFMGADAHTVTIKNGAYIECADPGAAGIVLVDASNSDVLITNDDGTNAAKVKITIVGGTT